MAEKKYKIGYTTGVFDLLHIGHLNILRRAKEQCDYLVVGVTTDELCLQRKGKRPVVCERDRMELVSAIRYVDRVVPQTDMDKRKAVLACHADAVFVGSDWQGTAAWQQYERELAKIGCAVVYFPYTEGVSSSLLRERLEAR